MKRTGAGKGDTPRKVNGAAYREGWERAFSKVSAHQEPEEFEEPAGELAARLDRQRIGKIDALGRRYMGQGGYQKVNTTESRRK